jgi:hypothetical protein
MCNGYAAAVGHDHLLTAFTDSWFGEKAKNNCMSPTDALPNFVGIGNRPSLTILSNILGLMAK